ncbi:hypothetical protein [Paraburkholderia azotifigens]|uniref:DUF4145 domain-containing protein n=1 Tax=Paraburkholderia azotifigens TaxID=2057004 RepID=A0A5C6VGI4_9BURK|nr:hypothetical protein [Paraburkholderia azotifigens]TXC84492.1 hypothetical protein FRZ40_29925 [Paraburkholderia azotifigens]
MIDSTADAAVRDALFEHKMFSAHAGGASYSLEHIRQLEGTWQYEAEAIRSALASMKADGLVSTGGSTWQATRAGLIAREMRWQQRGLRHPALLSGTTDCRDLMIALIASGGEEHEGGFAEQGLAQRALGVYLFGVGESECNALLDRLLADGVARRIDHGIGNWPARLLLSADGRRLYAQAIVPRLGLRPPATILAALEPERLPFDDLGLDATLADNLRFRWEEAERCVGARAWLAACALYGSILEVILVGWLERDLASAMRAVSTPRDRAGHAKPLERWTLAELITVATELDYLDAGHARHAQALRESRNLIHPHKQIRERSNPDGHLASISQQVVRAVLDALARTTLARSTS